MTSEATMSPCGLYRYTLTREIQKHGFHVCTIGVNPSTADAVKNDHTISKLMEFGQGFQWATFTMVNKFALRSTDVKQLALADDPDGPINYHHLFCEMAKADYIVPMWGSLGKLPLRLRSKWRRVCRMAQTIGKPMYAFGTCQDGQPKHPLTLAYSTQLQLWEPPL